MVADLFCTNDVTDPSAPMSQIRSSRIHIGENTMEIPRSIANVIGYGRLPQSFPDEIAELERFLEAPSNN